MASLGIAPMDWMTTLMSVARCARHLTEGFPSGGFCALDAQSARLCLSLRLLAPLVLGRRLVPEGKHRPTITYSENESAPRAIGSKFVDRVAVLVYLKEAARVVKSQPNRSI